MRLFWVGKGSTITLCQAMSIAIFQVRSAPLYQSLLMY